MSLASRRSRAAVVLSVLRLILVAAAVVLGIVAIVRDIDGFLQALSDIGVIRAVGSVALAVVGLRLSAEAWRISVRCVAGDLPRSAATRVFFVSQLGKYLPGGLWTILAQVERARVYGLSHANMGVAGIIFIGLHVVTGTIIATLTLPWGSRQAFADYWWMALFSLPAIVSVLPPVLRWVIDRALRLLRRPSLDRDVSGRAIAHMLASLALVWLAYGGSVLLLAQPLVEAEVAGGVFVLVLGSWAAAWVIGVIIIPAPAGLGPREVVIFLLLSPAVGPAGAASLAIALRVVHTFADLALAVAYSTFPWRQRAESGRRDEAVGGGSPINGHGTSG